MMIKNTLLALSTVLIAFAAEAQLTNDNRTNLGPTSPVSKTDWNSSSVKSKLAKKGGFSGSGWYNYRNSLTTGGETFVYFGTVALWPDSLPVQLYSDGPAHVGVYAMGQVFDPTSEWFIADETPQLTGFNRYSIDSVAFRYKYRHAVPGSVDTLLIDFFNDDKLAQLQFTGGARAYAPTYIPKNNRSGNITSTTKILLDDSYNTPSFFYPNSRSYNDILNIALPSTMNVKGGGKMAFTVTYKPGVSLAFGDTLVTGIDSVNLPVKQSNTFQPYMLQAETGIPDVSHNYALTSFDNTRYSTRTPEWYYPNNGFVKIRQMDAFFKLTYYNVSAKEINNQGYGLGSVYPNPVKAGNDIKINFALGKGENATITLFNLLGSKITDVASGKFTSGENSVTLNTSGLTPGVYVYTINAGAFKATKKFTVID